MIVSEATQKRLTFHDKTNPNFLYQNPAVSIKKIDFVFGVFAIANIGKDEILEECHYITYKSAECKSAVLNDYVFGVADDDAEEKSTANKVCEKNALVLGSGSIFNHSFQNNADYYLNVEKDVYVFYALRDISTGEQICINYGENWWQTRERTPENL